MLSSSDRDRIVIAAVINSTTDVRADSFRVEVLRDRPAGARSLTVAGEPQSGRRDSNSGPPVPQTGALTRLRHAPQRTPPYQAPSGIPSERRRCCDRDRNDDVPGRAAAVRLRRGPEGEEQEPPPRQAA